MSTNNNNNNNHPLATGSLIDVIYEKTANIEYTTNGNTVRTKINESLKGLYKQEKKLRLSTITIKISPDMDLNKATEIIEKEWTESMRQVSPTYWQDKENIYCQFMSQKDKDTFLQMTENDHPIKRNLLPLNKEGTHYKRNMIKIELPNVRTSILVSKIKAMITNTAQAECVFTELKEGKIINTTRNRAITLKTNGEGMKHILLTMNGSIPYVNVATNSKARLQAKVNCRPWVCKNCYSIGQHQCMGKICANCGAKEHQTATCPTKTKFCTNCKKRGHRARDIHCPIYLNSIVKEIRKMDIPLEFYENKELRTMFINAIQLK